MTQSAEDYENDQERIRLKHEGETNDDARPIIPKAPEVHPEVYRDVAPMLFRGFLVITATISDVTFVFKSLNQHEYDMIQLMGGTDERSHAFWDLFLAYGVFLVGGQNVLVDRQRWVPKIANTFRDMQPSAKAKVIRHLSELNRRSANATTLTEAYAMESYSRYRWAQFHGLDLSSSAVTGIDSTESLGLNWAQLTWRALNYYEDLATVYEREWDNAKFIGSCSAGKGMQKIYNKDHDRHRKEAEDLIARKDKILRHVIEGRPLEDGTTIRNGQVVEVATTVEQLADQLDRSLRGEQDWHDRVVAEHEQRALTQRQKQKDHLASLTEASNKKFEGRYISGGSNELVGLSPQQVAERIQRSRQIQAQDLARGMVYPDAEKADRLNKFLDRHGILGQDIETTIGVSDQDPSDAIHIPPPREPGKPWRP